MMMNQKPLRKYKYSTARMQMVSKEKGDIDCNRIKTYLMLILVLGHCMCVFRTVGWGDFFVEMPCIVIDYITDYIDFVTYAFVFVSGYLFYLNKLEKGKYRDVPQALLHRARRLLVPYFLIGSIWCYPIGKVTGKYEFSMYSFYENILLGKGVGQLWFLMMLYTVFVIFLLLGNLPIRTNCIIGFSFFAILNILSGYFSRLGGFFDAIQLSAAFRYAFSYYLGFLYYKYHLKISPFIAIIVNFGSFVSYMLVKVVGNGAIGEEYTMLMYGLKMILKMIFICTGIMLVISIDLFVKKYKKSDGRIANYFKENNFRVYLVHQQWIELSIVLLGGRVVSNLVLFASNLFFAFVGSFVMIQIYCCIIKKIDRKYI